MEAQIQAKIGGILHDHGGKTGYTLITYLEQDYEFWNWIRVLGFQLKITNRDCNIEQ